MTYNQARDYIITHAAALLLQPDGSGKGFICPICGSGSGKKGTGITTQDGIHYTCWAGCFKHSDIIDIIGQKYGKTEYREKLEITCKEAGVVIDGDPYMMVPLKNQKRAKIEQYEKTRQDFTGYFQARHNWIGQTDYPQRRGLSQEVLDHFCIGYDPEWRHPKSVAEGKNPPATPRLIIPTSPTSYLARDTRQDIPENQKQYSKQKVGSVHIFNPEALDDPEMPCFVVEGEIDAMSIIEVGGNALAIGSISNIDMLLRILSDRKPKQPIIISLDNDKAGIEAAQKLAAGLDKIGITYYRRNPFSGYKDANEALQKDREALRSAVSSVINEGLEEYLKTSSAAHLQSFIDGIAASVNTPCIPTGFKGLDNILDGGMYEGLYILGAISSLGKTSLALQICDQVAQAGTDVLIFSLEMARTELMAKSISRHTFILAHEQHPKDHHLANGLSKTSRGITDGKRYVNYSRTEKDLISDAVKEYSKYAGHIFIREGMGDIGVNQIREAIEKHIRFTGRTPLVLVDYLQIIAPYSDRATDKQNTDKAVLELKRISRDFKTAVVAVSSVNRANYKAEMSEAAYKESGAIEYSADVLIGLQLEGAGKDTFNSRDEKRKDPRHIELIILKNRNGATGSELKFDFYPRFNYFEETHVEEPF